jgi:hypothetical protein
MSLLHISAILLLELAAFLGPWFFVAIIASLLWRAGDRRVTRETNAFLEEQRNLRAYKALHERFLK